MQFLYKLLGSGDSDKAVVLEAKEICASCAAPVVQLSHKAMLAVPLDVWKAASALRIADTRTSLLLVWLIVGSRGGMSLKDVTMHAELAPSGKTVDPAKLKLES